MYFNVTEQIASSATASSAWSGNTTVLNFDNFDVHVIWKGIDTTTGTLKLMAGTLDSEEENEFSPLSDNVITMVCSGGSVATNDNVLFNITDCSYEYVKVVYDPVSNTTGTLDIYVTRKSRR